MEYTPKPVVKPSTAPMPLPAPVPQAPIAAAPLPAPMPLPVVKPSYEHVTVNYVHAHVVEKKAPVYSSTGVILVLFILLVIISRAKC
ncbi:hypothetical protein [Paenibacillus flagellatus]|uniref:Uncharacterized protein n=1 Tax=Paenibacillus flagellatus TaxID=2211139 RepID=A0A2V5K9B7_9BACL|nr:hypothetical protein [Paenibacillus flagellatus]PYI54483.1 hypothetical protein DLM86_13535 [Paenibacillus flagellatus]